MVLKLSSLIVSTIVCVSLVSAVSYRNRNENHHAFTQDDRIAFPELAGPQRQRPVIQVEYFENGTTIATYGDGTPVVRPATATETEHTESSTRLTGILNDLFSLFFFCRLLHSKHSKFDSISIWCIFIGGNPSRVSIDASLPSIEPKCLADDGTSFYCTKVENYPRSLIDNLLSKNADTIIFKSDKLDNELDQRFGGLPNDEPLCEFTDEVIYPESGLTHEDIPFFIVNTQKQQGVRVERCTTPDQSCTSKISFPLGYKSVCRQNHVYRELISPSNDLTALEKRKFKFPSCCSCMLQRINA